MIEREIEAAADLIEQVADTLDKAADAANPNLFGMALALNDRHIYEGTVDPAVVAKRRAKNKRARAARRVHRH